MNGPRERWLAAAHALTGRSSIGASLLVPLRCDACKHAYMTASVHALQPSSALMSQVGSAATGPMTYSGQFLDDAFSGFCTSFRCAQFSIEGGSFLAGVLHGVNTRRFTTTDRVVSKRGTYDRGTCLGGELFVCAPPHSWTTHAQAGGTCQECRKPAGMMNRHHCRACGHVVCNNCAPNSKKQTMVLADGSLVPNSRICNGCQRII